VSGGALAVTAPDGVPEVRAGDDLAALLLPLVELEDGDVLVVTSKVVSKAEGRVVAGTTRDEALAGETVRIVARRGLTTIVRTRHGLTMAAGGIDASNVEVGSVVLLPVDPDASAARLRAAVAERTGRNVGVLITDTAGRAWREGQTDIAVGAAGIILAEDFSGRVDAHGNPLVVTAPAVADELAGAAELSQGKLGGRPFAVVGGRADLVLPRGEDGPGARALVRPEGSDLFGYGAREAVVRALLGDPADRAPFGAPVSPEDLIEVLALVLGVDPVLEANDRLRVATERLDVVSALAFAHGWQVLEVGEAQGFTVEAVLQPATL
jgi:coenzyme F420-0:L-glutamate ligase/coenzyme F420-1:gamma-L-glutamate ligase